MTTSLQDKLSKLSPERRARIAKQAKMETFAYLTLQQLRKSVDITQVELADLLDVQQASISGMENRPDMLISSLRNMIEQLGGTLNLMVELPDQKPVLLEGLNIDTHVTR